MRPLFLTHSVIGSIDDQILILTNRQVVLTGVISRMRHKLVVTCLQTYWFQRICLYFKHTGNFKSLLNPEICEPLQISRFKPTVNCLFDRCKINQMPYLKQVAVFNTEIHENTFKLLKPVTSNMSVPSSNSFCLITSHILPQVVVHNTVLLVQITPELLSLASSQLQNKSQTIIIIVCLPKLIPEGKLVSGYISTHNNRPGHYSGHSQQTKFYVHRRNHQSLQASLCRRNKLIQPLGFRNKRLQLMSHSSHKWHVFN